MLPPVRTILTNAHVHRILWRAVMDELDRLPEPVTRLWRISYTVNYADSQVMAVRRIVEGTGSDEVSLGKLLQELATTASSIPIPDLLPGHGSNPPSAAVEALHAGAITLEWGDGSGHLRSDALLKVRDQLYRDTVAVRRWADRALAHAIPDSATRPLEAPTFEVLDQAIDDATDVYKRSVLLLTGVTTMVERPILLPNWTEPLGRIFRP